MQRAISVTRLCSTGKKINRPAKLRKPELRQIPLPRRQTPPSGRVTAFAGPETNGWNGLPTQSGVAAARSGVYLPEPMTVPPRHPSEVRELGWSAGRFLPATAGSGRKPTFYLQPVGRPGGWGVYGGGKVIFPGQPDVSDPLGDVYRPHKVVSDPQEVIYEAHRDVSDPQKLIYQGRGYVYHPHWDVYEGQKVIYEAEKAIYTPQQVIYDPQNVISRLEYQLGFTRGFSRSAG